MRAPSISATDAPAPLRPVGTRLARFVALGSTILGRVYNPARGGPGPYPKLASSRRNSPSGSGLAPTRSITQADTRFAPAAAAFGSTPRSQAARKAPAKASP